MSGVWVGEVEVGAPATPAGATRERRPDDGSARLLVRLHGQVLGVVSVPMTAGELSDAHVTEAVRSQLARPIARHLAQDGLALNDPATWTGTDACRACRERRRPRPSPELTVVVCTRDRPGMLAACLGRLQRLAYGPYNVIVVDNAPSSGAAREIFARTVGVDPRFRYVREDVPGLSHARNRGLAEARTGWVAFTDDDVLVDRWWLEAIVAGIRLDARAGCVTGLVPPAELDHATQRYFDQRFPWGRRLEPTVYSLEPGVGRSPLYPYSAGQFGTGANFAVDRELMQRLGGFDAALGAGSPASGGEELDAFVRILQAGRSIVYEPSAVVWHLHRSDRRALRRQLFGYGEGLTAFLTKYLVDARTTKEILRRLPEGGRQVLRMWKPAAIDGRESMGLVLAEAAGMVAGPLAYARGRRVRS